MLLPFLSKDPKPGYLTQSLMERIPDWKLEIELGETPVPEGMNRPREWPSRGSEPGEPETAGTLPPAGWRVKPDGGGRRRCEHGRHMTE